jgi:NAD(P)-dependent dehydrogenase (short-subunit alcohol dehydrogenase family)
MPEHELFDLKGKVAIVTGAGRGLGRAIALGLAEHGADLLAVSRSPDEVDQVAESARALGRRALSLRVDISLKSDVDKMAALAREEWGTVDILVNNAGVDRNQPAIDYDDGEWDRIVGTNLKGYFLCSQAIGRLMIAQGSGSIVMNSSIYGSVGAADNLPYGASKGGVNQLTRMLAVEWAPYSVRVNAIAPGYMTPMTRDDGQVGPGAKVEAWVKARTPMGRRGRPDELVGPIVFLASNASSYVTGCVLAVDGGWTAA